MNIRFVSSLTPDDENVIAPVLLKALSALLDAVAIPYAIRIETADAKTYEHCQADPSPAHDSAGDGGPRSIQRAALARDGIQQRSGPRRP